MGLWEFLQQWRARRTAVGIAASILLHALVVAAIIWGGGLPGASQVKAKKGDALFVELPKADESPAPGSPDVPPAAANPTPAGPRVPTPRQAPPAARPAPAPPRVASAPRTSAPTPAPARSAPQPVEPPRAEPPRAVPQRPAETASETPAETAPAGESSSSAATPKVERVPQAAANPQVASVPPGGAPGQSLPDIRSALRRGAGGRGQGWEGIEGEPVPLDTDDPDFAAYMQQVKRQIVAKWSFPCLKRNPATHECDQQNAQLYIVFGIHKSGRLQIIELQASSGYRVYDDYALNAVRLAAPYPPVPPAMLAKLKAGNLGLPVRAQFNYIVTTSFDTMVR
jgi:TonB family protein